MFKTKKRIVEEHLEMVNCLLKHAKEHDLPEAIANYTSQKLALEHVLEDFKRLWV